MSTKSQTPTETQVGPALAGEMERLFESCAPRAYRAALSVLRSPAEAEDMAQDACLAAFDHLRAGERIDDLPGYVAQAAYLRALNEVRRRRRLVAEEDVQLESADPINRAIAGASLAWKACSVLTPAERAAVILHVVERMSHREVGRALHIGEEAARKLVKRGQRKMLERCVELIGTRAGRPAGCESMSQLLRQSLTGELRGDGREELKAHLVDCAYCRETERQLLEAKQLLGFALLFPLAGLLSRKDSLLAALPARPVAAKQPIRWARRLAIASGVLLMLIGLGAIALTRPSGGDRPMPGARAHLAVLATTAPAPTANPCPSGPMGGLAYLSGGNLYYRSSPAAAPTQLTTSGTADNLWWRPGGQMLAFKDGTAGTTTGNVSMIPFGGGTRALLASGVDGFSFSPDGQSFATATVTYASGQLSGIRVTVGKVASPGSTTNGDLSLGGIQQSVAQQSFVESPVGPRAVTQPGWGVFWLADGIHVSYFGEQRTVDQGNLSGGAWSAYGPGDPLDAKLQAQRQPANSMLQQSPPGVLSSCSGAAQLVPFQPGTPRLLSVTSDGRTGVVTFIQGGPKADIYLVTADGHLTPLSTDHVSSLATWQPT